ncbi:hypothetical protein GH714_028940 [Hevea brasiliensis]|uniref:RNase H type-1 domain-containing protein n=1 Tax=Hevea brasiliensis TaxID=3981 RepID=A0A6A6LVG9_HEVBR|nr:hypothetical protein GH714_028940 [Hevea brasiliensis]
MNATQSEHLVVRLMSLRPVFGEILTPLIEDPDLDGGEGESKQPLEETRSNPQLHDQWAPPPENSIKINYIDTGVHERGNLGSVAALARDCRGHPLGWACRKFSAITESLSLEALACKEAILLAISKGYWQIHVEGDSLLIIKALATTPVRVQGINDIKGL